MSFLSPFLSATKPLSLYLDCFSGLFAGVQASSSVASSFLFLSSIFSDEGRSSYKFPAELDSLFPLALILNVWDFKT